MTEKISLLINDAPIPLDTFVAGFIEHTVTGMVTALRGTSEIKNLVLTIEGDQVTINLNDAPVPLNYFASNIIRNTIAGMVSSLKGVSEVHRLRLTLSR